MIKVARTLQPAVLSKKAAEWTRDYIAARAVLDADPGNITLKITAKSAESKYHQKEVQTALSSMFEGKCAYCESHVDHVAYPHIEHFKPKSTYPESCFDWGNMLWACGKCNGKEFKGDLFPLKNEGGPFVNPVEEDPASHFEFEYDEVTGVVFLNPISVRGETTARIMGLNRREMLVDHRRFYVKLVFTHAVRAITENDFLARSIVIEACQKSKEYAAFSRSIADRFGIDWRS